MNPLCVRPPRPPPARAPALRPFHFQMGLSGESPGDELNLCVAVQIILVIASAYRVREGNAAPIPAGISPALGGTVSGAGGCGGSVSGGAACV